MHPDIDTTYRILRKWAKEKKPKTYGDLSQAYKDQKGIWLEPHGTWDNTLGDINRRLDEAGLPPLSGLVVLQGVNQPGGGFWGSCSRTSKPLPNAEARFMEYITIVNEIFAADWPVSLP